MKPGQPEEHKKQAKPVKKPVASKKKGRRQQDDDEEEEAKASGETSQETVIPDEEIKRVLMASDLTEFKDNKEEGEILIESLSEFLLEPVNKQFHAIFVEAFARMSTKS